MYMCNTFDEIANILEVPPGHGSLLNFVQHVMQLDLPAHRRWESRHELRHLSILENSVP